MKSCVSAKQWYPLISSSTVRSGYIEQARIMLLHFILSQNGIFNGLQLDLHDIQQILLALNRADSITFLLMMHNCCAVDIHDPYGQWKAVARAIETSYTTAGDRLPDQDQSNI